MSDRCGLCRGKLSPPVVVANSPGIHKVVETCLECGQEWFHLKDVPTTVFERLHDFFESSAVTPEDRAAFIRAEVEAMDWPDTIGE